MSEMGAGSVARYGDAVFIKHLDGSWYKATYNPGGIGHSDVTIASFGEILYKASPLSGLDTGAIIAGPNALDVAIMGRNGMWYGTWDGGLTSEEIYTAFDGDVTIIRRKA